MAEPSTTQPKPDRRLGDEWEDWSGDLDESQFYEETARLFTLAAFFAVCLILGVLGFVLYLIEPRLMLLHPALVILGRTITIAVVLLFILSVILIAASVIMKRNFLFDTRFGQVAVSRIMPLSTSIARRFGISRDRLGNSFVAFSNAIVRATYTPRGETIILLPRCLSAEQRQQIKDLGEQTGVRVFTATGGGQARRILIEHRPSSVIGVACERDLISGIHDVSPKLPTIGVPNKRPEGPCKNTLVDIDEIKRAITTLTGKTFE